MLNADFRSPGCHDLRRLRARWVRAGNKGEVISARQSLRFSRKQLQGIDAGMESCGCRISSGGFQS
jgi:hypothetical protein